MRDVEKVFGAKNADRSTRGKKSRENSADHACNARVARDVSLKAAQNFSHRPFGLRPTVAHREMS